MSWIRKLFTRFFEDKQERASSIFLKGQDKMAKKNYSEAYRHFMKAHNIFGNNNKNMKRSALLNAAECAEKLESYERVSDLIYRAALLSNELDKSLHDTLSLLQKATYFRQKTDNRVSELLLYQQLFALAKKDFDLVEKISSRIKESKHKDRYSKYILETQRQVDERNTVVTQSLLPYGKNFLPSEFQSIYQQAQQMMRGYASLEIQLEPIKDEIVIKDGVFLNLKASLKSYAPDLMLQSLSIVTGNSGTLLEIIGFKEPVILSEKENLDVRFKLEPKFPGKWIVGPIKAVYSLEDENFEVFSDKTQTTVLEPKADLELSLAENCVEEDFGYEIIITAVNNSKAYIDNLNLKVIIPNDAELIDGTLNKRLGSLAPDEAFEYDLGVKFLESTKKTPQSVQVVATFGKNKTTKTIEIYNPEDLEDAMENNTK